MGQCTCIRLCLQLEDEVWHWHQTPFWLSLWQLLFERQPYVANRILVSPLVCLGFFRLSLLLAVLQLCVCTQPLTVPFVLVSHPCSVSVSGFVLHWFQLVLHNIGPHLRYFVKSGHHEPPKHVGFAHRQQRIVISAHALVKFLNPQVIGSFDDRKVHYFFYVCVHNKFALAILGFQSCVSCSPPGFRFAIFARTFGLTISNR